MPEKDRQMIRRLFLYPQLRNQIPKMIDNARRKMHKLQDATRTAESEWLDMEDEFGKLKAEADSKEFKLK